MVLRWRPRVLRKISGMKTLNPPICHAFSWMSKPVQLVKPDGALVEAQDHDEDISARNNEPIRSSSPESTPAEGRAKSKSSQAVDTETVQPGCPGDEIRIRRGVLQPQANQWAPRLLHLSIGICLYLLSSRWGPTREPRYSSSGAEDFILPQGPTTVIIDGAFGEWICLLGLTYSLYTSFRAPENAFD